MAVDHEALDHDFIRAHDLVERYLQNVLPPDEQERFEAHFVDCPQCLDQLELAEDFRTAMKDAATEDAVHVAASVGLSATATRRRRWALGGSAALVALTVIGMFAWHQRGLEKSLETQRAHLKALDQELRNARAQTAGLSPLANVPNLLLTVLRDGAAEGSQLALPADSEWLELAVEVNAEPQGAGYRVVLESDEGEILWHRKGLQPNRYDALEILFPTELLPPGDYRLMVETSLQDDGRVLLGHYPFRIVSAR